jgi:predicted enzyme related to lactoylglutathione lyase
MAKNPHYLPQLAHIEIYSPDVEKSVRFLRDIVGWMKPGVMMTPFISEPRATIFTISSK